MPVLCGLVLVLWWPTRLAASSTARDCSSASSWCLRRLLSLYPIDVTWSRGSEHPCRLWRKLFAGSTHVCWPATGDFKLSVLNFANWLKIFAYNLAIHLWCPHRGGGVRLRWMHADGRGSSIYDVRTEVEGSGSVGCMQTLGGEDSAPCGHPHRKLKPTGFILSSSHAKKLAFGGPEFHLWME